MRALQLDLPLADPSPGEEAAPRPVAAGAIAPADPDASPFIVEPLPARRRRAVPRREELLAKARELAERVARNLERPVRLFVTDNSSTMVSFQRLTDHLTLRVHHMFLDAPEPLVAALADYAGRGKRGAGAAIDAFVKAHSTRIRRADAARAAARLQARGKVYDLQEIFDRINAAWFEGAIDARIGWGRGGPTRRRRTIRMGVYDHLGRSIRIHPALDRSEVPRFFVEYIVFHEMLHQAVPAPSRGPRRQHHGPEFRRREEAWPDYARAMAWEKENLGLLLGKTTARRVRLD